MSDFIGVDYGSPFLSQISAFTSFRLCHTHCFSLIAGIYSDAYLILPEPAHAWLIVVSGFGFKLKRSLKHRQHCSEKKKKTIGYWWAKFRYLTHRESKTDFLYWHFIKKCKTLTSMFHFKCNRLQHCASSFGNTVSQGGVELLSDCN